MLSSKRSNSLRGRTTRDPRQIRPVRRRFIHTDRRTGLPESVNFHSLRHGFASIAAHRGVPVSVLSEVMGHSHVGVTQKVYMHLYGREQAEDAFRAAMSANQRLDVKSARLEQTRGEGSWKRR
jgi:integrase